MINEVDNCILRYRSGGSVASARMLAAGLVRKAPVTIRRAADWMGSNSLVYDVLARGTVVQSGSNQNFPYLGI